MANYSCNSCEDLRSTSPSFVVNGITDTECTSLQNNTGLNPSSGHDDCTDLNNINDCLVGNMAEEVEAYDVCDWKTYMKKFVPNAWTTLKSMICAICGLWKRVERLDCIVNYITQGHDFKFGESSTGSSYIVAGKGVSFLNVTASGTAADITLRYISGGLATIIGSCVFYTASFTDREACYNYDNEGVNPTRSSSRSGNSEWNADNQNPKGGTQLVYELRIKKSEYPQIKSMHEGIGLNASGGGFHAEIIVFNSGRYANGQNGTCDHGNGDPVGANSDRGHLVPDGWTYVQMRITWIEHMGADADGTQMSPHGLMGIRMNQNEIECD